MFRTTTELGIRPSISVSDFLCKIIDDLELESNSRSPRVKKEDSDSARKIRVYLPECKKEDITVDFEEKMLKVSAVVKDHEFEDDFKYEYSEYFKESVDIENISANFENNVLEVNVPFTEKQKTEIKIE